MGKVEMNIHEETLSMFIMEWTNYNCKHSDRLDLYRVLMDTIERALFKSTLEACRYNKLKASRRLGISLTFYQKRLRHYFGDEYFNRRAVPNSTI
ncbi:helix-turn-helix domain-containing protein [Legionella feeleii]|uniref:Global DNA-binding transcriptional dual regulator n=1 Tax=Legionella feeleii TaxID=453 RepID=A0A378IW73_9GAMM|nr:helix-turn-helix domain-containing protein [Legionella feeleii]STX38795.1 global DNA-binding transcriptional dual regulator [Legionella feeleii]